MTINALEIINKISPDRIDKLYRHGYTLDDAMQALSVLEDLKDPTLCSYVANVMRNCDGILYYTSCIKSHVTGQYTVLKLLYPDIPAIDTFFNKYALGYYEFATKCDPNSAAYNPQAIHELIIQRLNFEYANDLADLLSEISSYQTRERLGITLPMGALIGIAAITIVYLGYKVSKK